MAATLKDRWLLLVVNACRLSSEKLAGERNGSHREIKYNLTVSYFSTVLDITVISGISCYGEVHRKANCHGNAQEVATSVRAGSWWCLSK